MKTNNITDEEANTQIRALIKAERRLQMQQWGRQTHDDLFWSAILAEEAGESAHAVLERDISNLAEELVQVVAVAESWLQHIFTRDGAVESAAFHVVALAQDKRMKKLVNKKYDKAPSLDQILNAAASDFTKVTGAGANR